MAVQAQGSQTKIIMQREQTFKSIPTGANVDAKVLYYTTESLRQSRELLTSNIIRGSRQPSKPIRGNLDVSGAINTELQAHMNPLWLAAFGSLTSVETGATWNPAPASVTGLTRSLNIITAACTGHGFTIGQAIKIAGATGDTSVNGIWAVENVVGANSFTFRVPANTGAAITGTITAADITAGTPIWTHTLTVGGELPSYTIEKNFPELGKFFKYAGCKCGKLSVNITPSGFQEVTADFMGTGETVGDTSFDATPTDLSKVPFDGFAISGIYDGATPLTSISSIDGLTFENDLDGDSYVVGGAGTRRYIPAGLCKVTGTVRALFEDMILYNHALNNDETSLKVTYVNGTGDGTVGNEFLELNVPELLYKPQAPAIQGPKGIVIELPFEAYFDNAAEGAAATVTIKSTWGPGSF